MEGFDFNPHTREGCDLEPYKLDVIPIISIHTPARGVTGDIGDHGLALDHFNPHTREGCDYQQV